MSMSYNVAELSVEDETIIQKSRFICYLTPCTSPEQAKAIVKEVIELHPQARHHCYAFVTKAAHDSQGYGFSDDGEPSGTAGRPMLSALEYGGVGEVCAVVVRYFGGIKLGTGGLQRAYGGSVKQALTLMSTKIKVAMSEKALQCEYHQVDDVIHLLKQCNSEILAQTYLESVDFKVNVPLEKIESLNKQLQSMSAGAINLK
ncbi:MAG: YigZ family protein [Colwellia sp.]